jgi:hypothetical protein
MATSVSGGRSRSTWREPSIMGKQLLNFITCSCESSAPFVVIYKAGETGLNQIYLGPSFLLEIGVRFILKNCWNWCLTHESISWNDQAEVTWFVCYLQVAMMFNMKTTTLIKIGITVHSNLVLSRFGLDRFPQLCKLQQRVHSTHSCKW